MEESRLSVDEDMGSFSTSDTDIHVPDQDNEVCIISTTSVVAAACNTL